MSNNSSDRKKIRSKSREKSVLALIVIFLLLTVIQTWNSKKEDAQTPAIAKRYTLEMSLFNLAAKVAVGSIEMAKNQDAKLGSAYPDNFRWYKNRDFIKPYLLKEYPEIETDQVKIGKLILAGHLGLQDLIKTLSERYRDNSGPFANDLIDLIIFVYSDPSSSYADKKKYSAEHILGIAPLLENEFGWIGALLTVDGLKLFDSIRARDKLSPLLTQAKQSTILFGISLIIGATALILGLIMLIFLLVQLLVGKLNFNYRPGSVPAALLLEVFFIYLAAMNILFLFARQVSSQYQLLVTVLGTLSMIILILWPKFFGHSFDAITRSIGLRGNYSVVANIFVGPLFVAAMWPIFLTTISIYQIILKYFNVDIAQAEHPVVPVFLSTPSTLMILYLFIFAVIVAPIVEEIMFRGVLYGWLRSRYGFFMSMIASSVIFAIIHPQGALGIIPLSLIGCLLAFLREWRGNLCASMAAHATVNGVVLSFILQLR